MKKVILFCVFVALIISFEVNVASGKSKDKNIAEGEQIVKKKYYEFDIGYSMLQNILITFPDGTTMHSVGAINGVTIAMTDHTAPNLYCELSYFPSDGLIKSDDFILMWWGDPSNWYTEFKFEALNTTIEYRFKLLPMVYPFIGIGFTTMHLVGNESNRITSLLDFYVDYGVCFNIGKIITVQAKQYVLDGEFSHATYNGEKGKLYSPIKFKYEGLQLGILLNFRFNT